jgi:hypothetical protein
MNAPNPKPCPEDQPEPQSQGESFNDAIIVSRVVDCSNLVWGPPGSATITPPRPLRRPSDQPPTEMPPPEPS